eukprot:237498_1
MKELILFVIGCVASVCLLVTIVLSIVTGCILCKKYDVLHNNNNNQNLQLQKSCEEIDIHDIKMTAITLSQHANHQHKRSQSDPDILLIDSVALAIESPESATKSEKQETIERIHSSETIETEDSDEYNQSLSPLATPKSPSNTHSGHYRSHNAQITPFIEETNKSIKNPSLMSQIINMIDSDSEEALLYENKEEEENENENVVRNESRVAITRMIVGPNVRVISDESVITSMCSTNLSCSTNTSEYAAFINKSIKNNKCLEEQKIVEEDDNSDDNSSTTITYNNSIDEYNKLHGIAAVTTKNSWGNISPHIASHLAKLNEVDESQLRDLDKYMKQNEDDCVEGKQNLHEDKAPKKIKDLVEIRDRKEKRDSVTELQLNRVVKTRRPLFENSKNSLD